MLIFFQKRHPVFQGCLIRLECLDGESVNQAKRQYPESNRNPRRATVHLPLMVYPAHYWVIPGMRQLTPRLANGCLALVWHQPGAAFYPICKAMKKSSKNVSFKSAPKLLHSGAALWGLYQPWRRYAFAFWLLHGIILSLFIPT